MTGRNNIVRTRRRMLGILSGVVLVGGFAGVRGAEAHKGHDAPRLVAEAEVLAQHAGRLKLRLVVMNLGGTPLALGAVRARGARTVVLDPPLGVGVFDTQTIEIDLRFAAKARLAKAFTAYLDFGKDGLRPVLVIT